MYDGHPCPSNADYKPPFAPGSLGIRLIVPRRSLDRAAIDAAPFDGRGRPSYIKSPSIADSKPRPAARPWGIQPAHSNHGRLAGPASCAGFEPRWPSPRHRPSCGPYARSGPPTGQHPFPHRRPAGRAPISSCDLPPYGNFLKKRLTIATESLQSGRIAKCCGHSTVEIQYLVVRTDAADVLSPPGSGGDSSGRGCWADLV
jgi:hypothetical protein